VPEDFTKLPVGHVVAGRGKIMKCPKCGRNGLGWLFQDGSGPIEHFGLEVFVTASGDERGKRRRGGRCLMKKPPSTQSRISR
jgi:hypothetical protein